MIQDEEIEIPEMEVPPFERPVEAIRAAYEQMLMAWIRTTLLLMSLGFSIYKFFNGAPDSGRSGRILTPRFMGMLMISAGLLGLFVAHREHRVAYKHLRLFFPTVPRSLTSLLSGCIQFIGLFFFIAALFRQ